MKTFLAVVLLTIAAGTASAGPITSWMLVHTWQEFLDNFQEEYDTDPFTYMRWWQSEFSDCLAEAQDAGSSGEVFAAENSCFDTVGGDVEWNPNGTGGYGSPGS